MKVEVVPCLRRGNGLDNVQLGRGKWEFKLLFVCQVFQCAPQSFDTNEVGNDVGVSIIRFNLQLGLTLI